jgi:hypothetical protein
MTQAETVRQLLLTTNTNPIALQLGMELEEADDIRTTWRRRIEGLCPKCGAREGCRHNKALYGQPDPVEFFQELNPDLMAFKEKCLKCRTEFTETLGGLLGSIREYGFYKRKHICPDCKKS